MKAAAAHHSVPLVRNPGAPPGALARVGYRDNTSVTALPGWDGRHTHTVLPPEGSRQRGAKSDLSRGGGWPWTAGPSSECLGTARATR